MVFVAVVVDVILVIALAIGTPTITLYICLCFAYHTHTHTDERTFARTVCTVNIRHNRQSHIILSQQARPSNKLKHVQLVGIEPLRDVGQRAACTDPPVACVFTRLPAGIKVVYHRVIHSLHCCCHERKKIVRQKEVYRRMWGKGLLLFES